MREAERPCLTIPRFRRPPCIVGLVERKGVSSGWRLHCKCNVGLEERKCARPSRRACLTIPRFRRPPCIIVGPVERKGVSSGAPVRGRAVADKWRP